jgi:2-phospho-L-lactate guanylyltransferase
MLERSMPWLLLPARSLHAGKSRLAPALSKAERQELNEYFLLRTLTIAREVFGMQRIAVISDGHDSCDLAKRFGAHIIRQFGEGLNQAVTQGIQDLHRVGARAILVLSADLPFIRADDLTEVIDLGHRYSLVICTDRYHTGTNAIFLSQPLSIEFHFGNDSCRRHQEEAKKYGISYCVHLSARLARDIDVPKHLAELQECNDTPHVFRFQLRRV